MRFSKYLFLPILFILIFSNCKKNSSSITFTPNFYFINGGVADTVNTLLLFSSSDTVKYNIVISSTYLISSNTVVSVGVADEYRSSFNSIYGTNYQAMPESAYNLRDTITAGNTGLYDTVQIAINKKALSLNQKYLIPVKILNAGTYNIDSSASVLYLRTDNSTLSGIFKSFVTRTIFNSGDTTGNQISSIDTFTIIKNLVPLTPNSSQLDYSDLGPNGWKYYIGFSTEDNSFFAAPNSIILNSVQPNSFQVLSASFDSTSKDIHIRSTYKNSNGDARIVEESLTLY